MRTLAGDNHDAAGATAPVSEELDRLIALRTCMHEGTDWEFMEHTEVPSA